MTHRTTIFKHAVAVLLSLTLLFVGSTSVLAGEDGVWATDSAPGAMFQLSEGEVGWVDYLAMTVLQPDGTWQMYWGPEYGGEDTYSLEPLVSGSNMVSSWRSINDSQAVLTIISCSTNCMFQPGQQIVMIKYFGDDVILTGAEEGE